jgi:transposase
MNIDKILKIKQFKALDLDEKNGEVLIFGELINTEKTCPHCNTLAIKPHQYHNKKIRTAPFNTMPTYLVFTQKAYLCPACGRRFLEQVDFLEKKQQHTKKYEEYIYEQAKKQDISRVAELEGLCWDTVNNIFLKGTEKPKSSITRRKA